MPRFSQFSAHEEAEVQRHSMLAKFAASEAFSEEQRCQRFRS